MEKQSIFYLIGPPCSGKSTFAKKLAEDKGFKIVSRDAIREMLYGVYKMVMADESIISEIMENIKSLLIDEGHSVIVDNTNCNLKYFKKEVQSLQKQGLNTQFLSFQISEDVFEKRNDERFQRTGKYIPLEVYRKMAKGQEEVIKWIASIK